MGNHNLTTVKTGAGKGKYRYHVNNGTPKTNKKVVCIETDMEYNSITDCAKSVGVSTTTIWRHLRFPEKLEKVKGYTFEFV